MRAAGFALTYDAGAEVWHKGGASVRHRSPVHDYYDVRARLLLIHKHHPARLPLALGHTEFRCLLPKLMRGEWRRAAATLRAQRDFIAIAMSRDTPSDP
jgi:GT2 family glycosyltransferase